MSRYVAVALLFLASWVVLRLRGRKSILHNLPGPPSAPWLIGAWCNLFRHGIIHVDARSYVGNLKEFFDRDCWDYRAEYARQYGRVAKLHGMFGVRPPF